MQLQFGLRCQFRGSGFWSGQPHRAHIPAEAVEAGPGKPGLVKEVHRSAENSGQIPGDEIQITMIQSSGAAPQGAGLFSGLFGQGRFQLIPELHDPVTAVLSVKEVKRVEQEAGSGAVPVEQVHSVAFAAQIIADQHGEAGGAHGGIQPPVGLRVLFRFQLIDRVGSRQILLGGGRYLKAHGLHPVGQFAEQERIRPQRFGRNLKAPDQCHGGDFPQYLIHQGGEQPPGLILVLLEQGQQRVAVESQGEEVILGFFRQHLHLCAGNLQPSRGTQREVGRSLAPHMKVPVLQQFCRGMTLEVIQLIQPGQVPLGGEDQLILLTAVPYLKGRVGKGREQGALAQGNQLLLNRAAVFDVQQLAQLGFLVAEGLPGLLCAFPEVFCKAGKGQLPAAVLNHLQGICIAGTGFQSLLKVGQGQTLLAQVVVGIAHPEVPGVFPLKMVGIGQEQGQRLFKHLPVADVGGVVVGACQFAAQFRGELFLRNGLDGVDDLLVFVVFVPDLALFQQGHIDSLLWQWIPNKLFSVSGLCRGKEGVCCSLQQEKQRYLSRLMILRNPARRNL